MQVKKGDILDLSHRRKGNFRAIAIEDFDTDEADFFPVAYLEGGIHFASGGSNAQRSVACRASFVTHCEIVGHADEPEPGA